MSDTQRSRAALVALLADNTNREISEQDLRDVLVSVLGGYGHLYFFSKSVTANVATQNLVGWAAGVSSGVTPDGSAGTLTVPADGDYWIAFNASFTGTAGRKFTLSAPVSPLFSSAKIDAAGDIVSVSFAGFAPSSLVAGTPISIQYGADADGSALTFSSASLAIHRVG